MTSKTSQLFGPELAQIIEGNLILAGLLFLSALLIYQIGICKIVSIIFKQIFIMYLMAICSIIAYVSLSRRITALSGIVSADLLTQILNGKTSEIKANDEIIDLLTQMFMIFGGVMFVICILYQKLPIGLIPNFIPLIGSYDNIMAGFCSFTGLIICLSAVYIQHNYLNSSMSLLNKSKYYLQNAQDFIINDDTKWNNVIANNTIYFMQRGTQILNQSVTFISNQIEQQSNKNDL